MKTRRWTPDELATVERMRAEGCVNATIAEAVGRTAWQVSWFLRVCLGVRRRRGRPPHHAAAAISTSPRACLRCGGSFASEGPGNRLCAPCRGLAARDVGVVDDWACRLPARWRA